MQQFHDEEGFASWHAIELQDQECWPSHILSAMEGSTQSYMIKLKLLNCYKGYKGLQGWPTARVSGWWQLAGETKSTSVKNWN